MIESSSRDFLDRHGSTVHIINFESTDTDAHGNVWEQTADSPVETVARVDRADTIEIKRDDYGVGVDNEASIYVKDTLTGIRDGGGDSASEVIVDPGTRDAQTYVVLQRDKQHNGLYKLLCFRSTS